MFKTLTSIAMLTLSCTSFAYVQCPEAKVQYVQPDTDRVYIQLEGQKWQSLGMYESAGTSEKMAVALAAFASGKKVLLRFPDGHDPDCSASATTPVLMIRIMHE